LSLVDLKPGDNGQNEHKRRFSVSAAMNGDFLDSLRFLYLLQKPPHLFRVEEIEFEKLIKEKKEISMRCVLSKTFVPSERKVEKNERGEKVFREEFLPFDPQPFEVYAKRARERDLFLMAKHEIKTNIPVSLGARPVLQKRIKLIGILLDGDSKAIVEDVQEKQVHFLSMGESVGTVLLEDIRRDKVIFVYNNERVEMSL